VFVFSFLFFTRWAVVRLMPVLAACHLIFVSIVCIIFHYMLVVNKVLSLSLDQDRTAVYTDVCYGSSKNSSGAQQEAEQQQIKPCSGAVTSAGWCSVEP